ncbi:hypothetical protein [Lacticaseibacillus phage R3.1]|nr:hypothetical protein [Lacticaseibacillus phage R3.1]
MSSKPFLMVLLFCSTVWFVSSKAPEIAPEASFILEADRSASAPISVPHLEALLLASRAFLPHNSQIAIPAPATNATPRIAGAIGANVASNPVPPVAAMSAAGPKAEVPFAAASAAGAIFSASNAVLLKVAPNLLAPDTPSSPATRNLPMTPVIPEIPLLKAITGLRAPPIRELTGPTTAANAANLIMVCCVPLSIFVKALTTSVAVLIRGVSVGRNF